jgi:hypothetical protein
VLPFGFGYNDASCCSAAASGSLVQLRLLWAVNGGSFKLIQAEGYAPLHSTCILTSAAVYASAAEVLPGLGVLNASFFVSCLVAACRICID